MFRHYKGGRSSAKCTGCLYPRRNPRYSLSEAESTSGHMVLLGEPRKQSPVTPLGIDPGTDRTLNTNKKVKYKNFLQKVGRSWISEVQNCSESNSDDLQLPEKQTTPRGPKQDPPGRLSSDFRIDKLKKIVGGGEGKRKYPARPCKVCAAHKKRSETRYICKFCIVPLHKGSCFEKYHSVMSY